MAMLAGPRRKQKWSLNPRGKDWSEDSNKFGQKMLEKMGWSSGRGLGAKEQGMTEHVRVKMKNDQVGIGFEKERNDQWVDCQDGFSSLLQSLQQNQVESTKDNPGELSGASLEAMSKQSSVRVHYQKFTRGKDVNRYSKKDLANIFGKKTLEEEYKKRDPEKFEPEVVGSKNLKSGVLLIQGGSMTDYFNSKINSNNLQTSKPKRDSSDSESEQRPGFGHFTFDNPCLNVSEEKCDFGFDNPCLDISGSESRVQVGVEEICDTPYLPKTKKKDKKKSNFYVCESPAELITNQSPLKNKSIKTFDNGLDNPALDIDILENGSRPSRKRKRNLEPELVQVVEPQIITPKKGKKIKGSKCKNGFSNEALDLNVPDYQTDLSINFEVPRTPTRPTSDFEVQRTLKNGIDNSALNLMDDEADTSDKKTKEEYEVVSDKLKKKENSERECQGIVNEALQDEDPNTEQLQNEANERKIRKRQRRERRISTLETIVEVSEDETERPTAEIKQKKPKPNSDIDITSEIVDISNEPQEVVSKKKKKKKKNKQKDSEEAKENSSERKKKSKSEELSIEEFLTEVNQEVPSSRKSSKKVLKSLFKKNPTLVFQGSNVNEIKGYGTQFYKD